MKQNRLTTKDQHIKNDPFIRNNYKVISRIGQGQFSLVFRVQNIKTNTQSALKVQFIPNQEETKKTPLQNQINILKHLSGVQGVPEIRNSGKWKRGVFLEMELFKESLQAEYGKKINLSKMYQTVRSIILLLKQIHKKKVIHQDLKPKNVMKNSKGKYFIIDFGLSKRIDLNDEQKISSFIGTPRFASISAHKNQAQTEQDDIQSLLYSMASLYDQKLPWSNLKVPLEKKLLKIQLEKQENAEACFSKISEPFLLVYKYIRNLNETDVLDYDLLLSFLSTDKSSTILKNTSQKILKKQQIEEVEYSQTSIKVFDGTYFTINIELQKKWEEDCQTDLQEINEQVNFQHFDKCQRFLVMKNPFIKFG